MLNDIQSFMVKLFLNNLRGELFWEGVPFTDWLPGVSQTAHGRRRTGGVVAEMFPFTLQRKSRIHQLIYHIKGSLTVRWVGMFMSLFQRNYKV